MLSAFSILIHEKYPVFLLMSYLYGECSNQTHIGQFGRIYQLNHWMELNMRRQPYSLLTSALSGKHIISSLLNSQKQIYLCNCRNYSPITCLQHYCPIYINWQIYVCLFPFLQHQRNDVYQT